MDTGDREAVVGVTSFKARCLALIDDVAQGRKDRVLLIKRNKPVAAVVPINTDAPELWGALRGTVTVTPGIDLTEPTGQLWDAER